MKLVKADVPPANTVKLTISGVSSQVDIAWNTTEVPNIYYMTGDGTGSFSSDTAKWTKIDFSSLPNSTMYLDPPAQPTKLVHMKQFSKTLADGAIPEVYYKGLVAGTNPTDIDPATGKAYLEEAWAVGKYDVPINTGLNLVTVPFYIEDSTVEQAIGHQLPINSVIEHYTGTGYYTADYLFDKGANKWVNKMGILIKPSFGFWIKAPSNNIMTLTGNLLKPSQIPYSNRNIDTGLSLFGLPHPKPFSLGLAGFLPNEGDVVEKFTGSGYVTADYLGGFWVNKSNISLEPGKGYWYKRQGAAGFKWQLNPNQ